MAKRKGKKKSVAKVVPAQPKADFVTGVHLGEGLEDFPYQKGTMQDVGKEFADEFGIMAVPSATITAPKFVAGLIISVACIYCLIVAITPIV